MTIGILLALISALATAFAHALLKAGDDKLAVQAWVRLTGCAIALPLALYLGPPPRDLVPWIVGAAAIHAVYQLVLTWSYSVNDFSVAYPLARGISPVATCLLGIAVLGDPYSATVLAGVAVVSGGVIALSRGRGITPAGIVAAACAGLLTTAYTLVDAHGVRIAPTAILFIAWFYVADGVSMPVALVVRERRGAVRQLVANAGIGFPAGLLSLLAFAPALYAFKLAPVGVVAALREGSVLIGLVIGGAMLNERIDRRRIIAAMLIVAGSIGIIAGSAVI